MSVIMGVPIKLLLRRLDELEQRIVDDPRSTTWTDASPTRFEIMR